MPRFPVFRFLRRSLPWAILLAILLSSSGLPAAFGTAVARALDLEELTLENGMEVILIPRPGCGLIASNVFVGAGSTREQDRYAGSSHFLEHLLFNGTQRRTQEEIYAFEDRIGAYNNATTKQEYTHYMIVAPSERIREALDLQSDMLLHSILPPGKFEKERGIVIEEIVKDSDDPDHRVSSALDSLLHREDPPFAREVLGTAETIAALPRDAVLEYYHRQYVPSNMRMVLMGDFDREEVLGLLRRFFSIETGDRLPPLRPPSLKLSAEGLSRVDTRPVDAPTVTARASTALQPARPRDWAALALLMEILGGGEESRLQKAMDADPSIPVQSVGAGSSWMGGKALVQLEARLAPPADLSGLWTRFASALASLGTLDPIEVEAARTRLLTAEVSQLEQLHYYALFHGDRLSAMPRGYLPAYLRGLEELTPHELEEYAAKYLAAPTLHFDAAGSEVPRQDGFLEEDPADPGLAQRLQAPPSEGVELPARRRPPHLAAAQAPRATRLANGMLLIHSAVPQTRMVALHLLVKNRSAREPQGREGLADILHRMLPQTGPTALQDRIGAELKVADNPWIPFDDYYTTPLYSFVRLATTDEFYRESIPYLAWMCRRDFQDSTALDKVKTQLRGVLMRQEGSSREKARRRFAQLLYPGHPLSHGTLPSLEVLGSVDLGEIQDFARDYLVPSEMILAVVGDVPYREALDRVCDAFATRALDRSPVLDSTLAPLPLTTASRREELAVGGRQSNLLMGRVVQVEPDDLWALKVAVMIASKRMQQDLRETRGLAYRLSIGLRLVGKRAAIVAQMGTQPKNLEEAEKSVKQYMVSGDLLVDEDEIATAVNSRLGRMRMRTMTSMGQAFTLCRNAFLEGELDATRKEATGLAKVGIEDVARAARRYLGEGPLVVVIAR